MHVTVQKIRHYPTPLALAHQGFAWTKLRNGSTRKLRSRPSPQHHVFGLTSLCTLDVCFWQLIGYDISYKAAGSRAMLRALQLCTSTFTTDMWHRLCAPGTDNGASTIWARLPSPNSGLCALMPFHPAYTWRCDRLQPVAEIRSCLYLERNRLRALRQCSDRYRSSLI